MADKETTVADGPPPSAIPVKKPATPDVPAGGVEGGPPPTAIAVKKDATAAAPAPLPAERKPLTGWGVVKDIPREIYKDAKHGMETVAKGVDKGRGTLGEQLLSVPQAALGAGEIAGAPITGAVKAAIVEPFKQVIPQDTVWGKMAVNTIGDAAVIFGPGAASKLGKEFVSMVPAAKSAVKNLMDGGVQLTIGQISGDLAKRFEEGAKSVPILGHFIRQAEARTLNSWNVATVNRALGPLGKVEAKDAREALTKAEDMLDKQYDKVRAGVPSLHKDADLEKDILDLQTKIGELPEGLQNQFDAIIMNRLNNRFGVVGAMDGTAFKKADSELRVVADGLRSSADNAQRELGHAVTDLRMAMRTALRRQYPAIADDLAEVDSAFAKIADIQRAGTSSAVSAGRFTPGQYLEKLRRSDRSARDKDFLGGLRPLQDWAEDAYKVIGNKLPDSGTAERLNITELGKAVVGTEAGHIFGVPPEALAAAAAPIPLYTETGQKAVNAVAGASPQIGPATGAAMRGGAAASTAAQAVGQ